MFRMFSLTIKFYVLFFLWKFKLVVEEILTFGGNSIRKMFLLLLKIPFRFLFVASTVEIWLFMRLGALGVVMIGSVALLAVIEHQYRTVDPGLVGLAITLALSMESRFQSFIMIFTRAEKAMVNTERILYYAKETPQEPEGTLQVSYLIKF